MIGKGVAKPSYTQRPAFFAATLGALAAIAGILLVMGFVGTKEAIEQRKQEDLQRSLAQVLPAELYDNQPSLEFVDLAQADGDAVRFYQASLAGEPVAVAFEMAEGGYAGPIRLVMGVSVDGSILGVRVLSHTETPGLGDKIEANRDDWILAFDGLSFDSLPAARWGVKKDGGVFDQFAGATITPRAVVRAVKRGLELHAREAVALYQAQREQAGLAASEAPAMADNREANQ